MSTKSLFYIGLTSLIISTLYLLQHISSPFFASPLLDQHYYDLCARELAGEGNSIIDGFRPLLYPLFIAVFYKVNPESGVIFSILAQHILGVGMAILIARIAAQTFKNTKSGVIAGILFCLSAPPLYFEGQLLITTVFSFLLLLVWLATLQAMEATSTKSSALLWTLTGITLGLASQARPNALPLILFFPALVAFRWLKPKASCLPRHQAFLPLLAIPGLLLIQIAFGAINAQYSGKFSLMTQAGGINFYLGNSKSADGMIPRQDRHVVYDGEYKDPIQVMAEQGFREATEKSGPVSQKEVSDFWKQKTIQEIKEHPARWLHLMAKKTWLMLWNHEVPNNRSFEFAATQDTPLLKWLPVRWWLLLALFPWGIAILLKKQRKEQLLWISLFFIIFSGTIMIFFVNSRFRIPLWPGMTIMAGGGALYLWDSIRAKAIPWIPAACSALLLSTSLINWFGIPPDPIENDLSMRSKAYYEQGLLDEAYNDITQCIQIAPANPRYHFSQGNILLAAENNNAAISAYIQAIKLNPSDPMFFNNLGIAFEGAGNYQEAEKAYDQAITLRPDYFSARTNLMLLFIRTDQLNKAKFLLSDLISKQPSNPTLLCAKAVVSYKKSGSENDLNRAKSINERLAEQLIK